MQAVVGVIVSVGRVELSTAVNRMIWVPHVGSVNIRVPTELRMPHDSRTNL